MVIFILKNEKKKSEKRKADFWKKEGKEAGIETGKRIGKKKKKKALKMGEKVGGGQGCFRRDIWRILVGTWTKIFRARKPCKFKEIWLFCFCNGTKMELINGGLRSCDGRNRLGGKGVHRCNTHLINTPFNTELNPRHSTI